MAIEYKAFSGGKEIDSFYSGGKEIQEIWGGDTLLWKKGSSSVSFDLTVTEGLDYFVPPSSFFTAIKQIFLNPLLLDVPLNRDNIEFGFYGEDEITTSGNTRRVSSYAYLLCKAKTEELKKNIDKVLFYTCDVDGKGADGSDDATNGRSGSYPQNQKNGSRGCEIYPHFCYDSQCLSG